MKSGKTILYVVYAVFGAYLINFAFGFYPIPEAIQGFDKIIIGIGGVLLLVSMFNPFRKVLM